MAWFSFHGGHSGAFCRHAGSSLEAVLEAAVAKGFTHYGISEHAPKFREQDLAPDEQDLSCADTQAMFHAYVDEAFALRERFADRLQVLAGFETEMVPPSSFADNMRTLRASAPFDYLVGSVHTVGDWCIDMSPEIFDEAATAHGGIDALDAAYFDQVAALVETLEPEVAGHLDLIRIFRSAAPEFAASTWPHIERALEAVRSVGAVLDVNAAPIRKKLGPVYPIPAILRRAREMNIGVTLGDDSHGPDHVGLGLSECVRAIADAGYSEICCLVRADGIEKRPIPIDEVHP
jgi:histidinol-phosphatase (PHP family)